MAGIPFPDELKKMIPMRGPSLEDDRCFVLNGHPDQFLVWFRSHVDMVSHIFKIRLEPNAENFTRVVDMYHQVTNSRFQFRMLTGLPIPWLHTGREIDTFLARLDQDGIAYERMENLRILLRTYYQGDFGYRFYIILEQSAPDVLRIQHMETYLFPHTRDIITPDLVETVQLDMLGHIRDLLAETSGRNFEVGEPERSARAPGINIYHVFLVRDQRIPVLAILMDINRGAIIQYDVGIFLPEGGDRIRSLQEKAFRALPADQIMYHYFGAEAEPVLKPLFRTRSLLVPVSVRDVPTQYPVMAKMRDSGRCGRR